MLESKFRMNIILLCIGLVLWWTIFLYLNNHPWEKASILPSLQILAQKWESMRYRITKKNPEVIAVKNSLIKSFDELQYLTEWSEKCRTSWLLGEIEKGKKEVEKLSYEEVISKRNLYLIEISTIKDKIDTTCN